jgi:hypothetical protein
MIITKVDIIIAVSLTFGFTLGWVSKPREIQIVEVTHVKEAPKVDPPCIRMYNSIEKYSKKYKIPRKYAFGIAYKETTYLGPDHKDYNHSQTSSAGALGPMQIMPTTAEMVNGKRVESTKLKNDIEYNVETSMKILRKLKDRHKNWKIVFGAYNTGRPIINRYAEQVYCYKPKF